MAQSQPPIATRDDRVIPQTRTQKLGTSDGTSRTGDTNEDRVEEKEEDVPYGMRRNRTNRTRQLLIRKGGDPEL